ncbi:MAG: DUF2203 domain-containing protein [Candidatus Aenigmarchaeota archaeon]|nr:DUF2203 domain-containing protein [Candidatus Aenigmarchaeota archaeon]
MGIEKKYHSVIEAQSLIPLVRQSLSKIIEINGAMTVLKQINVKYEDHYEDIHKEITMNKKFFELNYLLFKELETLLEMGVVVKDLNAGLVDFFSKYRGKEIFLCWRVGEDRISYWHEIGNGFTGRKPISMLS